MVMHLNEYQIEAADTAIYRGRNSFMGIFYCALKLNGEAGEIAEKVGKAWRDSGGELNPDIKHKLALELGDVLWYIANLGEELGYSLNEIANLNLDKLQSRKERGVLSGSGDNR